MPVPDAVERAYSYADVLGDDVPEHVRLARTFTRIGIVPTAHESGLPEGCWWACDWPECPPDPRIMWHPFCDACMISLFAAAQEYRDAGKAVVRPVPGRRIPQGLLATFEQCQEDRVKHGLEKVRVPDLT